MPAGLVVLLLFCTQKVSPFSEEFWVEETALNPPALIEKLKVVENEVTFTCLVYHAAPASC